MPLLWFVLMSNEPSTERFLIVKGSGGAGLGDKLRALISAIVYAQWSGRTLYVDWNDPAYGDGIRNYFPDLFRLEGIRTAHKRPLAESVHPATWRNRLNLNLDQIYEECGAPPWNYSWARNIFSFDQGVRDWDETICVMFDFLQFSSLVPCLPGLYPSIKGDEPEEWIQGEILRRHVKPSEAVAAMLTPQLTRLNALRPFVGVHVRATDEHFRARVAPPIAKYVRAVRTAMRKSGAQAVFLATDNRAVQDLFVRKFGADRVLWIDKWLPEPGGAIHLDGTCPDRLQAARDALLDILLLASADFLVTFHSSSFSIITRMFSTTTSDRRISLAAKLPLWRRVTAKMARSLGWANKRGGK